VLAFRMRKQQAEAYLKALRLCLAEWKFMRAASVKVPFLTNFSSPSCCETKHETFPPPRSSSRLSRARSIECDVSGCTHVASLTLKERKSIPLEQLNCVSVFNNVHVCSNWDTSCMETFQPPSSSFEVSSPGRKSNLQ
jgi:hypothetical protein